MTFFSSSKITFIVLLVVGALVLTFVYIAARNQATGVFEVKESAGESESEQLIRVLTSVLGEPNLTVGELRELIQNTISGSSSSGSFHTLASSNLSPIDFNVVGSSRFFESRVWPDSGVINVRIRHDSSNFTNPSLFLIFVKKGSFANIQNPTVDDYLTNSLSSSTTHEKKVTTEGNIFVTTNDLSVSPPIKNHISIVLVGTIPKSNVPGETSVTITTPTNSVIGSTTDYDLFVFFKDNLNFDINFYYSSLVVNANLAFRSKINGEIFAGSTFFSTILESEAMNSLSQLGFSTSNEFNYPINSAIIVAHIVVVDSKKFFNSAFYFGTETESDLINVIFKENFMVTGQPVSESSLLLPPSQQSPLTSNYLKIFGPSNHPFITAEIVLDLSYESSSSGSGSSFVSQPLTNKEVYNAVLELFDKSVGTGKVLDEDGKYITCVKIIAPEPPPVIPTIIKIRLDDPNDLTFLVPFIVGEEYDNVVIDFGVPGKPKRTINTGFRVGDLFFDEYPGVGEYTITFESGDAIGGFCFLFIDPVENRSLIISNDSYKVVEVVQWGTVVKFRSGAFYDASYLVKVSTIDGPKFFGTSLQNFFCVAKLLNEGDFGLWDVGSVTNMAGMFWGATSFDQPLNNWNVGSVTDMTGMFYGAVSFNKPLDNWDVGSVKDMSGMFLGAGSFNQPLDDWDVRSVTDMTGMFRMATSFNKTLNSWNVGSVTNMSGMFLGAGSFNQPLNNWNIKSVRYLEYFLFNSGISVENFETTIVAWSNLSELQRNVDFVNIIEISKQNNQNIIDAIENLKTEFEWSDVS